ncbi:MAG: hypothetical protein PSX81_02940 [bacterium]|nr:hypothetical protein [bacterium]
MKNLFEKTIEWIGWLQIVASPLLIGFALGVIVYINFYNAIGLSFGILSTIIGLVIGIRFATKKLKGEGTMSFLSKVIASHELNKKEEE